MRCFLRQSRLLRGAGLLTAAVGLLGALGWHLGDLVLVRIHPVLAPLPYLTALGLIVVGVGFALLGHWPRLGLAAACGGVLLGLLATMELADVQLDLLTPQWP